ncbi:GNAT family N-acetyltransferase [Pseudobacter ginsenosidimutans]|jgi:GNAT superfamily N-acetyltransferase|uniref:Acetyltransferase (GNAT) family protein n=1 Tax=Pseudobacter ginsenosidimutans TaxID=661488 RepID=A0A4Q7MRY5_9BACT|nr:GNAT family N-acetyltransferase [Pseudobacter ginsenosidimutans]QEC41828.1 GNAT family N-acetyltransferase [Pseudobacter ginsenosidimutans]RZS71357.1 acetyltransferase (GNAT) family protein [Pseudobacter ginsenosidimutans]
MNWQKDKFAIDTDKSKLDTAYIRGKLAATYWAEDIPLSIVERSIENSLCFGVYVGAQQIGFARMITDKASFAYLCDVFIDEDYRGQGLSKWLMSAIMGHPDLQGLRRFMLATRDAHGLYRQYGFNELVAPERWMEISVPGIYKKMKTQQ